MKQHTLTLSSLATATSILAAIIACNAGQPAPGSSSATIDAILDTPQADGNADAEEIKDPDNPEPEETEATVTATLQPTPTPPEKRLGNGADIHVQRCEDDILVDAQDEDWNEQEIDLFEMEENTFGAGRWEGVDDLSGQVRMCWTSETLFLFVDVIDDTHVQTQEGSTQWQGDEIEIMFDAGLRGDFYDEQFSSDDTQIGLSPGDLADSPYSAIRYVPRPIEELENVEIEARRPIGPGGNYVFEAELPWAALGLSRIDADTPYGMCVALSDNDQVGESSQDSMVSHCPDLITNVPTTWANVFFDS